MTGALTFADGVVIGLLAGLSFALIVVAVVFVAAGAASDRIVARLTDDLPDGPSARR